MNTTCCACLHLVLMSADVLAVHHAGADIQSCGSAVARVTPNFSLGKNRRSEVIVASGQMSFAMTSEPKPMCVQQRLGARPRPQGWVFFDCSCVAQESRTAMMRYRLLMPRQNKIHLQSP